jgi:hypothetical protein
VKVLLLSTLLNLVWSAPLYDDSLTSYTVSFANGTTLPGTISQFINSTTGRITTCATKNDNCTTAFNAIPSLNCVRAYNDVVPPEFEFFVILLHKVQDVLDEVSNGARLKSLQSSGATAKAANGTILAIDADSYYGLYPEDLAEKASNQGYAAVMYLVENPTDDDFNVGSTALRFWKTFEESCPTPVIFVKKTWSNNGFIANGNVVHIVFKINLEAKWLRGGEYYGLIFTPAIISIAVLSIVSLRKLYHKGAPCVINFSVTVLYCGLLQCILYCKFQLCILSHCFSLQPSSFLTV